MFFFLSRRLKNLFTWKHSDKNPSFTKKTKNKKLTLFYNWIYRMVEPHLRTCLPSISLLVRRQSPIEFKGLTLD